jgi:hypothetical protein
MYLSISTRSNNGLPINRKRGWFPIAGAGAAGYFVFLTVKFILAGGIHGFKNIIGACLKK